MSFNPLNVINNVDDLLFPGANNRQFIIYTNDVLGTDSELANSQQDVAIRLTTFLDFRYGNNVNFAHEPIENSSFNVDSVQDNPFNINLLGVCAPVANSLFDSSAPVQQLNDVVMALEKYLHNVTMLTIIQEKPFFRYYKNIKLVDYNQIQVAARPNIFYGHIMFKEGRVASLTPAGTLQVNQVSNPASSTVVNTGSVAPKAPTTSESNTLRPPIERS